MAPPSTTPWPAGTPKLAPRASRSHAALLRTCQMPCKSGCPSRVRGGEYGVVAAVCPAPGIGVSAQIAARPNINRMSRRLTGEPPLGSFARALPPWVAIVASDVKAVLYTFHHERAFRAGDDSDEKAFRC